MREYMCRPCTHKSRTLCRKLTRFSAAVRHQPRRPPLAKDQANVQKKRLTELYCKTDARDGCYSIRCRRLLGLSVCKAMPSLAPRGRAYHVHPLWPHVLKYFLAFPFWTTKSSLEQRSI